MRLFRSLCVLSWGAALASAAVAQTGDVALVNAHVETGDGKVLSSGTVLIHGGKIAGVGEKLPVPDGYRTIDATGISVYPGFIDAYCTSGIKVPDAPAAATPPDTRTTAQPSMWHQNRKGIRSDVVVAKCLDLKSRMKDEYAQGITTLLLTPGSGVSGSIRGVAAVVDLAGDGTILEPDAAVELSFRNGSGAGYPGTLFGVIAELRQTLADAQYYKQSLPAKQDLALENLGPLVSRQTPALFAVDTERDIWRASRIADEFGFKLIVGGGKEAYRDLDLIKEKGYPVVVNAALDTEPTLKADTGISATPKEVLAERHDLWVEHSKNVAKLQEVGVPIAFGSEGELVDEFLPNIRKVIAAGLPRDAALKALTSGGAAILGVGDRVGTIAEGKTANLVLMSGDFADPKTTVKSVFVEGNQVDIKVAAK